MQSRAGPDAANRFPNRRDIAIVITLLAVEAWCASRRKLLLIIPVLAQEAPPASTSVKLDGAVKTPATYSMAELAALSSASITLTIRAMMPPAAAGRRAADGADRQGRHGRRDGAYLQHVIIARGTDGYGVAIAIGEIEPKFEGKQVVVAYQKDGVTLPSLRLIIPGDAHAGRDVRLTELTLR